MLNFEMSKKVKQKSKVKQLKNWNLSKRFFLKNSLASEQWSGKESSWFEFEMAQRTDVVDL